LAENLPRSASAIGFMGALPTYPSEKYGYIRCAPDNSITAPLMKVDTFIEKPDAQKAALLIEEGSFWNCGIFCFQIKDMIPYAAHYGLTLSYPDVYARFGELPKISFDYEVAEKAPVRVALPYDGFWKDIGTWNTLTEQMTVHTVGDAILDDSCENTHVINELDMPVIVMGMKDTVIAASFDGILVTDKYHSSFIKEHVDSIRKPAMYEERSWGYIKILDSTVHDGMRTNTSKVVVLAGMTAIFNITGTGSTILVILRGRGEVCSDNGRRTFTAGEIYTLPAGHGHEVRALTELEFIEVKTHGE
jgi:mannose-1-phosphate guanylyltransferase